MALNHFSRKACQSITLMHSYQRAPHGFVETVCLHISVRRYHLTLVCGLVWDARRRGFIFKTCKSGLHQNRRIHRYFQRSLALTAITDDEGGSAENRRSLRCGCASAVEEIAARAIYTRDQAGPRAHAPMILVTVVDVLRRYAREHRLYHRSDVHRIV